MLEQSKRNRAHFKAAPEKRFQQQYTRWHHTARTPMQSALVLVVGVLLIT